MPILKKKTAKPPARKPALPARIKQPAKPVVSPAAQERLNRARLRLRMTQHNEALDAGQPSPHYPGLGLMTWRDDSEFRQWTPEGRAEADRKIKVEADKRERLATLKEARRKRERAERRASAPAKAKPAKASVTGVVTAKRAAVEAIEW